MAQYRTQQNFTWEALKSAQSARNRINNVVVQLSGQTDSDSRRTTLSNEKLSKTRTFQSKFDQAVSDDFNMPEALAVVWETIKSNIPSEDKYDLLMSFDEILGLNLNEQSTMSNDQSIPDEIKKLAEKREQLRKEKKYDEADEVRKEIEKKGYIIEDTSAGPQVKPQ